MYGKFMRDNVSTIWFCVCCSISLWTSWTWTLQNLAFAANRFRFRIRFRRHRFLRFNLLHTKTKVQFLILLLHSVNEFKNSRTPHARTSDVDGASFTIFPCSFSLSVRIGETLCCNKKKKNQRREIGIETNRT